MATSIGAVPATGKRTVVQGGGVWVDTPYFGPGLEKDSEHMKAFPVGMQLAGKLMAIRTTKAEKEADQKDYLCLEDVNGTKFRIAAPGQLVFLAEQVLTERGVGALIVVTYKGKEVVQGYKQALHQFQVELVESLN